MIDAKKIVKEYGLTPNKALGQNFLTDIAALEAIVELASCAGEDVFEIGPGLGTLTDALAESASSVTAVEIDKKMCELLETTLAGRDNVRIIGSDILRLKNDEIAALFSSGFIIAANLPYYITTETAMKFIDSPLKIKRMVLMMQQEAAAHFTAAAKEKCYTPVTVLSNRYYTVREALRLSPSCYYPEPAVNSSVLVFERNEAAYDKGFTKLVKAAFMMRRKTLKNNLSALLGKESTDEVIENALLKPTVRAEELTHEDFSRILESARMIIGNGAI